MTSFKRDLFLLRKYYDLLIQLLEIHFGTGYTISISDETNRVYIKLCMKIEEILNKPNFFDVVRSYEWRPFENLLSMDPDYPEGDWELGRSQQCYEIKSKIEELFIRNGEETFELTSDEKHFVMEIQLFLEKYKHKKMSNDKTFEENIEKMKPFFTQKEQGSETKNEALEIQTDHFHGIMNVFISHKFVIEDQKLAITLRNHLRQKNIEGYLAESKKEYELLIGEKIRQAIDNSDYVVGIITKESEKSASVNQELGYALGKKIPILIMLEKDAKHGVLTHGREVEEFTRGQFDSPCTKVVTYILEKGKRTRDADNNNEWLKTNVYEPCYNSMMNAYKINFIAQIPDNPWERLTPYAKLKTEPEMKELFDRYTRELNKWSTMWMDFEYNFQNNRDNLAKILLPAFQRVGISDEIGRIDNGEGSTWGLQDWIHNCNDVLFDTRIQNEEDLYQHLRSDMIRRWGRFYGMLDKWKKEKQEIYAEILKLIPELVKVLGAKYSYQQIDEQRPLLKESIEKLTLALEDKLK